MERKPNILDRIGKHIPGYTGYARREVCRQCDKVLREHVAHQVANCETILQERINSLINAREHQPAQDLEGCRKRLNTLSGKISYAPYGDSAFFSECQIKEDELGKLHQIDKEILLCVEENMKAMPTLTVTEIESFIARILQTLDNRNQILKEHK